MVSDLSIYTFIYNVLIDNRGLRSELSQFKRTKLLISGSWVRTPQRLPFFLSITVGYFKDPHLELWSFHAR